MILEVNHNPLEQYEMIKDQSKMLLDSIYASEKIRRKYYVKKNK